MAPLTHKSEAIDWEGKLVQSEVQQVYEFEKFKYKFSGCCNS